MQIGDLDFFICMPAALLDERPGDLRRGLVSSEVGVVASLLGLLFWSLDSKIQGHRPDVRAPCGFKAGATCKRTRD